MLADVSWEMLTIGLNLYIIISDMRRDMFYMYNTNRVY